MANVIIKRKSIDNSIIAELKEKYPPISDKNGVIYSQALSYVTMDIKDIDGKLIEFDMKVGFGTFNVIIFYMNEMISYGYKVRCDGAEYNRLLRTCYAMVGVDSDKVHTILTFLIENNYFFKIADEDGEYLTTTQVVYDYERYMNAKKSNRERANKSRSKSKEKKTVQSDDLHYAFDDYPITPAYSSDDDIPLCPELTDEEKARYEDEYLNYSPSNEDIEF